ncbi:MAG: hypothetical protein J5818_03105 [Eggerthellaceae bacterium]|nr:hypothetical protein [Eggerthellaceae bacterium]
MPSVDKLSHASLNSIYVKAQELDRNHNDEPPPPFVLPGAVADVVSHASDWASDAQTHASDYPDVETHASTHASTRSSDAEAHVTE